MVPNYRWTYVLGADTTTALKEWREHRTSVLLSEIWLLVSIVLYDRRRYPLPVYHSRLWSLEACDVHRDDTRHEERTTLFLFLRITMGGTVLDELWRRYLQQEVAIARRQMNMLKRVY